MKIVGFHAKNLTIANSEGDVIQNPPYLKWLLRHPKDTIQVVYDLGFCIGSLMNCVGINEQGKNELLKTTQLHVAPYKYRYIPNKFFSVKRNNQHLSYFCNLSQYFDVFDAGKFATFNSETDEAYCIRMAIGAKKIGETVYASLESFGLKPASLTSLIRIYENAKRENVGLGLDFEQLRKNIAEKLTK